MKPIRVMVPVADMAALEAELVRLAQENQALRTTIAVMQYARPNPPMPMRPPNSQQARTVPDPEDLAAAGRLGPARAPLSVPVSSAVFEQLRRGARPRRRRPRPRA